MTKYPIALHLRCQECTNYLLLHSAFTFTLECSVFPIQSSALYSKEAANKKEYVQNSMQGKCGRCSVSDECDARVGVISPIWSWTHTLHYVLLVLLNLFKNSNDCTKYIKQIMNVLSFM